MKWGIDVVHRIVKGKTVPINSEEPKVVEEARPEKPRLSLVVILSVVLGILLTLGGVGAVLHLRDSKALQAEVLVMRAELKKKNVALDEMQAQIGALSSQMTLLKDSAAARSGSASERAKQKEVAAAVADGGEPKPPSGKEKAASPEVPVPPKVAKQKPPAQNCELVGKSPEEQAATLKRCVSLIDQPSPKEKAR